MARQFGPFLVKLLKQETRKSNVLVCVLCLLLSEYMRDVIYVCMCSLNINKLIVGLSSDMESDSVSFSFFSNLSGRRVQGPVCVTN